MYYSIGVNFLAKPFNTACPKSLTNKEKVILEIFNTEEEE